MHPQHVPSSRSLYENYFIAAAHLGFPKAVVEASPKVQARNQSFAARQLDVSHPDQAATDSHKTGKAVNGEE